MSSWNTIKHRVKDRSAPHDRTLTLRKIWISNQDCKDCGTRTVTGLHPQKSYSATMEHIIPLSKGGLHRIDNVELLCHKCNSKRNQVRMTHDKPVVNFSVWGFTVIIKYKKGKKK